jgi:hypothetical protein
MGYTTDFTGKFNLDKPLTPEHRAYLEAFAQTRRMQRNAEKAATMPDLIREAAGLPIGEQGGYFVGSTKDYGQDHTPDVTDYNQEPTGQPGLWCQWTPNEDGSAIEWDQGEKFYRYVEWIEYLIRHFLSPWGYTLNGTVEYQGEDSSDKGRIVIVNNGVKNTNRSRNYR